MNARAPDLLRPRRLALWAALATALLLFQLIYGLRLLNAGDAYWTNPHGDMAQMLAGELAGLRAPWSLPLLTPRTLTAPNAVSLVYTDSIPWLTVLLKLTHLGPVLSLLGTFLFIAWLAQAGSMYLLLRTCGVRRGTTLFAGAVLALLVPAWLGRQIGHVALSGHALQILGLALAVHGARRGTTARGVAAFTALAVLAAGVHPYHLPPITLMFAAALAADALQRRPGALARAAWAAPAYLTTVLMAAWALGYFVGRGASGGMAALGFWEMNILAPVWPQASTLAGQKWTGDWFTHAFDPTGGQLYEGFNYLGAGVLLLAAAAGVLLWRERRPLRAAAAVRTPPNWRRWTPLAAALAALAMYAFGLNGWLGPVQIWSLKVRDEPWMEPLALFRCHGRFFWTVGYALLAGALTVADRASGARLRAGLLTAVVALQAADMSGMLGALNDRFSRPDELKTPAGWDTPALEGRDIAFYPGVFCTSSALNQSLIHQMAIMAQRRHASTNSAPTARPPREGCGVAPPPEALRDAAPGDRRITVLLSPDADASALTTLFKGRSDCSSDGVIFVCGRDLGAVKGVHPVAGAELVAATTVDVAVPLNTPPANAALLSGWSPPEATGVWSLASRAVLRLPTPKPPAGGVETVTIEALGFRPRGRPAQRAWVSVGTERLAAWRLDTEGYHGFQIKVPSRLLHPGAPLDIVIDLPDAISPDEVIPGSGDVRRLGIGVRRVTLTH